jgi:hypothetical protein
LLLFWGQLNNLTLPSLETFYIAVSKNQPGSFSTSAITYFVIRSGCSLTKLVIKYRLGAIKRDLIELFLVTPDLETLEIGSCHTPYLQDIVLEPLVFNKNRPTVLPRLRSLTLIYREDPDDDDYALVSNIAKSRTDTSLEDSSPGKLYAILEHVRVVSPQLHTLYRAIRHFVNWEDPFDIPSFPYLEVSDIVLNSHSHPPNST